MTEIVAENSAPPAGSPWRTIEETAAHYRTTVKTMRFWRRRNYGPRGQRLGNHVRYHQSEIERFDRELAASTEQLSA